MGAILYVLLTGRPPFRGTTALETLEQVKTTEPVPPSRLAPGLPRDLETICLKCLQKEPGKRYDSAAALADDLQRFRERRPILARPIGGAERAWRWCLRNRWIAGMTGVAAAAASVGLAALVAIVVVQQRANLALQTSNLNLLAANTREESARRLAQTRYDLARKTVEAYYTGASEDVLLKQPELEDLRKRLLQTALEFYREMATTLADSPDNTTGTRDELARAYFVVAAITEEVGSKEDALAAFQRVRAIVEDLLREKPEDEALRKRQADCLDHLAYLASSTGRRDDASRAYSEALAIREGLLKGYPDDTILLRETAQILQGIGKFQQEDGRHEDALRSYRRALSYHDEVARLRPEDVVNQNKRASVLQDMGLLQGETNPEDGARALETAVEVHHRIVRDHPDDDYLKALAAGCNDLAMLYWRLNLYDEAFGRYQETLALYEDLARRHPTINELRNHVATAHYDIGFIHTSKKRPDQALQSFRTALPIQEALVKTYPTVVDYQNLLSKTYYQLGLLHRRLGHWDEALSWYGKALPLQEAAHRANPGLTKVTENLAWTLNNLGYLQSLMGRTNEALRSYDRAVQYRRQLVESNPTVYAWREQLGWSYHLLSNVKSAVGDTSGAMEANQQAVTISESVVRDHPKDARLKHQLISLQSARVNLLGNAHLASGDPVAAQQSYNKARAFLESLTDPDKVDFAELTRTYSLLSACPAPGGPPPTPEGQAARQALADRAVINLRRAVGAGFREWRWCAKEADLNALRARDDFQALINDMAFPADPFAH